MHTATEGASIRPRICAGTRRAGRDPGVATTRVELQREFLSRGSDQAVGEVAPELSGIFDDAVGCLPVAPRQPRHRVPPFDVPLYCAVRVLRSYRPGEE